MTAETKIHPLLARVERLQRDIAQQQEWRDEHVAKLAQLKLDHPGKQVPSMRYPVEHPAVTRERQQLRQTTTRLNKTKQYLESAIRDWEDRSDPDAARRRIDTIQKQLRLKIEEARRAFGGRVEKQVEALEFFYADLGIEINPLAVEQLRLGAEYVARHAKWMEEALDALEVE